jgi:phosphoenolpyruvate-protein kinase (PTS system EI component)
LADLATPYQPAVQRLIAMVCRAADAHGRTVGVCGEAAADPLAAALFAGLGVTELSVAPRSVAALRAAVATFDPPTVRAVANRVLAASTADEVRAIASTGLRGMASLASSA